MRLFATQLHSVVSSPFSKTSTKSARKSDALRDGPKNRFSKTVYYGVTGSIGVKQGDLSIDAKFVLDGKLLDLQAYRLYTSNNYAYKPFY